MANIGRTVSSAQQNVTSSELTIYCNGKSNQYWLGTWAFVVKDREGRIRDERCGVCENKVSNVVAEYRAVIEGLRWAITNSKDRSVEVCTNLKLIVEQENGGNKVKTIKLLPLRNEVRDLRKKANAKLSWIRRKQNKLARRLSPSANCPQNYRGLGNA